MRKVLFCQLDRLKHCFINSRCYFNVQKASFFFSFPSHKNPSRSAPADSRAGPRASSEKAAEHCSVEDVRQGADTVRSPLVHAANLYVMTSPPTVTSSHGVRNAVTQSHHRIRMRQKRRRRRRRRRRHLASYSTATAATHCPNTMIAADGPKSSESSYAVWTLNCPEVT